MQALPPRRIGPVRGPANNKHTRDADHVLRSPTLSPAVPRGHPARLQPLAARRLRPRLRRRLDRLLPLPARAAEPAGMADGAGRAGVLQLGRVPHPQVPRPPQAPAGADVLQAPYRRPPQLLRRRPDALRTGTRLAGDPVPGLAGGGLQPRRAARLEPARPAERQPRRAVRRDPAAGLPQLRDLPRLRTPAAGASAQPPAVDPPHAPPARTASPSRADADAQLQPGLPVDGPSTGKRNPPRSAP